MDFVLMDDEEKDPVACYVDNILGYYNELSELSNLAPSPHINGIFEGLVDLCSQTPDDWIATKVLSDPRLMAIAPHLLRLCSDAEYQLELKWARKISRCHGQENANAMLLTFPYYKNYEDLIRMELCALAAVKAKDSILLRFAVIGSGPLPLTSLCIWNQLRISGACVHCQNIDQASLAISVSKTMCQSLGYTADKVDFRGAKAADKDLDLSSFDVVYLAALVGQSNENKYGILVNLVKNMKPGTLVVIRSAHSLRRLLYPAMDITTKMISFGLKPLLVVHPYDSIINSAVIAVVVLCPERCP